MNIKDIKGPADIKGLSIAELKDVAKQMRMAVLERTSRIGGHVGPNLGMVEATIAMHYVFDSPTDKIVFDVSHQSYLHKILTGRVDGFIDPEKYSSISGYTNPGESEHDFFTVGHTSTGVSLASGLAKARDIRGEKFNVIAVVGDGSLSGGEAFEGLDYGATLGSNFIVVVNDNDMSIAHNHGGLYADLHLLRTTRGEAPVNYFRSLGYAYRFVGHGNDLQSLIDAFRDVKDIDHPVVVHLVTEKGNGYTPAEENKEKWHWESPYDIATGKVFADADSTPDYSSLTAQHLLGMMHDNPNIVAITAGTPTVMGFGPDERRAAGRQFVDVGIAEEQAAALASGIAKGDARPIWGVWSTFVQRAYDQIAQDIAINNNPAVIAVFGGGVRGMNDVTHLCWFDIPLLSNIPNIVMLAPTGKDEYLAMLNWAMAQTSHPVVIHVPSMTPVSLPVPVDTDYSDLNTFSLVRSGSDVAVIAVGQTMVNALKAADMLAAEGTNVTVINPRFVSGLDEEMLSALTPDHKAVLTVEDSCLAGGFGEKVAAFYGDSPMLVRNLGLPREFLDRYDVSELAERCHLTAEGIADTVREMFK